MPAPGRQRARKSPAVALPLAASQAGVSREPDVCLFTGGIPFPFMRDPPDVVGGQLVVLGWLGLFNVNFIKPFVFFQNQEIEKNACHLKKPKNKTMSSITV